MSFLDWRSAFVGLCDVAGGAQRGSWLSFAPHAGPLEGGLSAFVLRHRRMQGARSGRSTPESSPAAEL